MDKARIHDLEGLYSAAQCRVDELDGALDAAYMANEALEAQAAAMREALEWMKAISYSREDDLEQWPGQETREIIDAALASDAGRELLERLRKAEVERVEVYPKYGFCRVSGCAFWENDKCGRGTIACMAARFHDYLRDHDMIREAE